MWIWVQFSSLAMEKRSCTPQREPKGSSATWAATISHRQTHQTEQKHQNLYPAGKVRRKDHAVHGHTQNRDQPAQTFPQRAHQPSARAGGRRPEARPPAAERRPQGPPRTEFVSAFSSHSTSFPAQASLCRRDRTERIAYGMRIFFYCYHNALLPPRSNPAAGGFAPFVRPVRPGSFAGGAGRCFAKNS